MIGSGIVHGAPCLSTHREIAVAAAVPKSGNSRPFATAVRRVALFDKAAAALGVQKLAEAMGVSRRAVNHKIATDRGLSDADLRAAADAVAARADELAKLASDMRGLLA